MGDDPRCATSTAPRGRQLIGSGGDMPDLLEAIRRICTALPEVTERSSHGAPTWFVRDKKTFAMLWADGHHDNGFPHLWLAAPPGEQEALVTARPETFFRPPYVGHRGWVGVRLDGDVDWTEVAELCTEAFRVVAPARLSALLPDAG